MSDTKSDIEDKADRTQSSSVHSKRQGMESSVLKFTNVNFTVGSGGKEKHLLTDVSATVKYGRVLASKYTPAL